MCKTTSCSADYQTSPTLSELEHVAGKRVPADFTAPELLSLGGLTLAREYEGLSSHIIERIESCIKDPRWEPMVVHSQTEMLRQRIYQIMAGFEDADDCDKLCGDGILEICAGRSASDEIDLASKPAMTHMVNRLPRRELFNIGEAIFLYICDMPRKKSTEEFIADARKVHGDKYDYSKAKYLGVHTKLCIICPKHGEFWQEVNNHLHGAGCPKCKSEANSERYRSSSEEFIKKARHIHRGKYDYSKVEYLHNEKNVCIICPKHGEFWQSPHNHLHGAGCPKCSNNYIPSTEEFISESKTIFGEKYDYSKVDYQGNKRKVCIICPEHGEFWITPNNHLKNHGCPKCSGNYGIDLNYFLEKADERFHGGYDYSKVEWKGYQKKVCIICPEHGEFWQTPDCHLKSLGCPKCSGRYMDQDFFIVKSRLIHGDKYDYSKVIYSNSQTKVCIVCPKHGEFWEKPNSHLQGHGCRLCYNETTSSRLTKSATNFLSIAQAIHKNKYNYSEIEYVNRRTPIKIICPKHGPFIQTPKDHIRGAGCPMCNNSFLEDTVTSLLNRNNIPFVPQKTFDWLKYNGTLRLDFYLYEHNIVIECQGIQHFKPIDYFGGELGYKENKKRDAVKKALCEKRGLKVYYYSNLGIHYPYEVIEDPAVLLQIINSVKTGVVPIWQPDPELPFNE